MKKLLALIALLLLSAPAYAATYYASPSGGGAASCVDNGANVCTLARAVVVASTGTNTIECATGTYSITTELSLGSGNTGANLTFTCPSGTCTWGSSGSSAVVDIETTMVSGTVTFDHITIDDNGADYSIRNQSPEVNVVITNSTINNTDASAGNGYFSTVDTTNKISLVSGEDTVTNLRTGATTNVKIAQKIVVGGSNITGNRVSFKLQRRCGNKSGNCNQFVSGESWDYRNADTLTATIETDSAGAPSGTPVTNGTSQTNLAFDTPYVSDEWVSFRFTSNVTLTASTTYWLVLAGNYTASTSNYIAASTDTGDGYASGDSATFDGTNWSAASAGTDLLFTFDRMHTRDLTITDSTFTTRSTCIVTNWSDDVIIDGNTLTSTASGIVSTAQNNQSTTADITFDRIEITDNVIDMQGGGTTGFLTAGVNTFSLTYTNVIIVKGNSGTFNIITQPKFYIHKLFIYGNDFDVVYTGNAPMILGLEVDGSDPQEINDNPFDQIVIENNNFNYTGSSHNHLFLFGIGTEDGIFINNTVTAVNNSGASGGGWGLVDKASRWLFIGNKFYGPGPGLYLTNNHSRALYNTFESYDSTGSNAAMLFRSNQDNDYYGGHGNPRFNFVENNIFISNGSSTNFSAIAVCDTANCDTASPANMGPGYTSEYWSNRIDNNIYYARDSANYYRIGAGTSAENVTLAEGLATVRSTWASSTYTNSNSISQYNDMSSNSYIGSISGVSGVSSVFTTSDPNVVNKGTITGTNIGGYQVSGSQAGGPFGQAPFGGGF